MIGVAHDLACGALFCVVQRSDGVGLSATSHDRAIIAEGMTFEPSPSLEGATISMSSDLSDCSLEFAGALSSEAMREDDLAAGRWAMASIVLSGGDWQVGGPTHVHCTGLLSVIEARGGRLAGKVDLAPPNLHNQPCPQTSPECRARLGDRHCRIDMRGRSWRSRILAADGLRLTVGSADLSRFRSGSVRWLTGANSGIDQAVIATEEDDVILREPAPYAVRIGDVVVLTEGCDGRLDTCRDRFANVLNYRGEPHLPGTDFVTRYPGG